jgi:hypothetical protein
MSQDHGGRSLDPDEPDERPPVALGVEMAKARGAEARHRETAHAPSPLAGVRYDLVLGEGDLFRFVESSRDEAILQCVHYCRGLDPRERAEVRSSLTMDDFYTLLTFARRAALRALRANDSDIVVPGIEAISLIDAERIDWRDAVWESALLAYAGGRTGLNVSDTFTAAASAAEPGIAEVLDRFAHERVDNLEDEWGYRELATPAGVILVSDGGEPFAPTTDLVSIAFAIVALIEDSPWRVSDVETGSDMPPVWLHRGDPKAVEIALNSMRGCVAINGALSPSASTHPAAQQLTVFLGEFADTNAADAIAAATGPGSRGGFAGVGVAGGPVCAVMVSRSVMKGVAAYESEVSLERFRAGLVTILTEAAA